MSISVVLKHESRPELYWMEVPYLQADASWNSSNYPLLAGVDPHGNTIFNARQMRQLSEEISRLLEDDLSESERRGLEGVIELCNRGQRPPHHYLWFMGD